LDNKVEFDNWFESIASKLSDREISFRKIFKYLDSPAVANVTQIDKIDQNSKSENWKILSSPSPSPTIGGKGFLVHEYASHVGAQLVFSHYQAAWKGFNK